jgi:hypothetical protein
MEEDEGVVWENYFLFPFFHFVSSHTRNLCRVQSMSERYSERDAYQNRRDICSVWYNNHFTGLDKPLGRQEVESSRNLRQ